MLHRCEHIAGWLVQFQMGGLLGVGAAAVVREVRVRSTGEKYALKIVTIHDPRMRSIALQEASLFAYLKEKKFGKFFCHTRLPKGSTSGRLVLKFSPGSPLGGGSASG